ncbi:MAG: glycosyltransferase family 1 protein [Methylovulum sp.]|nr:glycosyltransferase family 1 protein [Methylovulum sp.]
MNIPAQNPAPAVYVVEEQANPSSDFFVLPAIEAHRLKVIRCGFADLPTAAELSGAIVLFVRYVPTQWLKLVEAVRPTLQSLIFFMDDDVLDLEASVGMPWRYHLKLMRLAASRSRWLRRQKAVLWVSTPYLQQKYAAWQPRLVLPSAVMPPTGLRRIFYHGSASHQADIRWLRPVIAEVLQQDTNLVFEIIGGQAVYRLYKDLPRVNVVHPMKWPDYQAFIALQTYHIGLNPLQDIPFNRARSYTKFFDITRCKAVGIYSPDSACAEVISDRRDGLIVELKQDAWAEAILTLAQNESLRQTLLQHAEIKMRDLTVDAELGYVELMGLSTGLNDKPNL